MEQKIVMFLAYISLKWYLYSNIYILKCFSCLIYFIFKNMRLYLKYFNLVVSMEKYAMDILPCCCILGKHLICHLLIVNGFL